MIREAHAVLYGDDLFTALRRAMEFIEPLAGCGNGGWRLDVQNHGSNGWAVTVDLVPDRPTIGRMDEFSGNRGDD